MQTLPSRIGATLITLACALLCSAALALPRDRTELQRFKRANPCPATGQSKGACPGWQVDHVKPLMRGGKDHPSNMAWVTVEEHKAKTKHELATCKKAKVCKHRGLKRTKIT